MVRKPLKSLISLHVTCFIGEAHDLHCKQCIPSVWTTYTANNTHAPCGDGLSLPFFRTALPLVVLNERFLFWPILVRSPRVLQAVLRHTYGEKPTRNDSQAYDAMFQPRVRLTHRQRAWYFREHLNMLQTNSLTVRIRST